MSNIFDKNFISRTTLSSERGWYREREKHDEVCISGFAEAGRMAIVIVHSTAPVAWMNARTYRLIEAALRQKWENVQSTRASDEAELHAFLQAVTPASPPFVFNIAEYLDEKRARGFLPGMLDAWGVPHLGSSGRSILQSRDEEAVRKLLVAKGLPVPRFFITKPPDPLLRERAGAVGYPLTVRQLRKDGAAVARPAILAHNFGSLNETVLRMCRLRRSAALVEEYIGGEDVREFKVGIIGTSIRFHLPVEIDVAGLDRRQRMSGIEVKEMDPRTVKPDVERATAAAINDLADATFAATGASDFARVDIRARGSQFFVLGIGMMPGLAPNSLLPLAARTLLGLDHGDFVRLLASESIKRQGLLAVA
jgi:D-alanine-D-alanine ligase-like ATP-grasp enzyme